MVILLVLLLIPATRPAVPLLVWLASSWRRRRISPKGPFEEEEDEDEEDEGGINSFQWSDRREHRRRRRSGRRSAGAERTRGRSLSRAKWEVGITMWGGQEGRSADICVNKRNKAERRKTEI